MNIYRYGNHVGKHVGKQLFIHSQLTLSFTCNRACGIPGKCKSNIHSPFNSVPPTPEINIWLLLVAKCSTVFASYLLIFCRLLFDAGQVVGSWKRGWWEIWEWKTNKNKELKDAKMPPAAQGNGRFECWFSVGLTSFHMTHLIHF